MVATNCLSDVCTDLTKYSKSNRSLCQMAWLCTVVQQGLPYHSPTLGIQEEVIRGHCKHRLGCCLAKFMLFIAGAMLSLFCVDGTVQPASQNSGNKSQTEVGLCSDRFINGFSMSCMLTELCAALCILAKIGSFLMILLLVFSYLSAIYRTESSDLTVVICSSRCWFYLK